MCGILVQIAIYLFIVPIIFAIFPLLGAIIGISWLVWLIKQFCDVITESRLRKEAIFMERRRAAIPRPQDDLPRQTLRDDQELRW